VADEVEVTAQASSPWFNIFHVDSLGPFETVESIEMLRVLSARSGYELSEPECLFLIDVIGNQPFYLQAAGYRLYGEREYASLDGRARIAALRDTLIAFPQDMEMHLRYLLEHLTPADIEALSLAAAGKRSSDRKAVLRLVRLGLIREVEDRLEITSGMMREFVAALPKSSLLAKARNSDAWKAFIAVAQKAVGVAVEKAVEAASGKYLG
jgi:hypothetical protein